MSGEFRGYGAIQYVEQPPESELCFAAILSSVSGAPVEVSQAVLEQHDLTDESGAVAAFNKELSLTVGSTALTITPLKRSLQPETVMERINEQLEDGKAVAVHHKKTGNPNDNDHHWLVITGYRADDGRKGEFHVMDPLRDRELDPVPTSNDAYDSLGMRYVSRGRIMQIIRQSTDIDRGGMGIAPYALSADAYPEASTTELAVIYAFDQEPEPLKDTYSATGQDKPIAKNVSE